MEINQFKNIVIIGLGLIGGSIARDIKRIDPNKPVYAIDKDSSAIQSAVRNKDIDQEIDIHQALELKSALIIIATPISTVRNIANTLSSCQSKNPTIVMDVASIKTDIVDLFESLTNRHVEFVGTHPMAGTEFTGYEHARLSLFHAKPWIVCKHGKNTEEAIQRVQKFITSLGGIYRQIPAEDHDEMVSLVSHAMLMMSNMIFDLVATGSTKSLELAGDGFKGVVRTAGGNPQLHSEILENNRTKIIESLKLINSRIQEHIDSGLSELDFEYFAKNVKRHHKWIYTKK